MERYTYFDGGKWRLKIGDTEYSGDWVDRLAAYEETGLEPEELAQAEKKGRLVVLQNVKYTDSDGEKALRHAMYMCGVQNNPVTRYTADAIAEKLTREAAEAALDAMGGENNA